MLRIDSSSNFAPVIPRTLIVFCYVHRSTALYLKPIRLFVDTSDHSPTPYPDPERLHNWYHNFKKMKSVTESQQVSALSPPSSALMPITTHAKQILASNSFDSDFGSYSDTDETIVSLAMTESSNEDDNTDDLGSDLDGEIRTESRSWCTSSSDNDNHSHLETKKRSVSFGPIHVRQYERIVGDHPDTRVGVPLAIGWAYNEDECMSIERYEVDRARRGRANLRLTSITRKNMLLNVYGIPKEDILRAEAETEKLQKQRKQALRNHSLSAKTERFTKQIGKRMRKGGISFLKGMAYASQIGMAGGGSSLSSAAKHVF
mmetsp:Transcript_34579/g.81516  ORF Transcript_34579/g.81516 Transcript_34579/m.81516 type:complete len:317 (+) Transcript_34579:189-1139(+)